jgi:hypothetical protein
MRMFLARDVVLLEGYEYQEVSNKAAAESIFMVLYAYFHS